MIAQVETRDTYYCARDWTWVFEFDVLACCFSSMRCLSIFWGLGMPDGGRSGSWIPLHAYISLGYNMWLWSWCQQIRTIFSQTWLPVRYVWQMAWQIRLSICRLWRACILLRGFNFSGIFLYGMNEWWIKTSFIIHSYHIVAWPSATHPSKLTIEDRPRGSSPPPRGLNRKGVIKQANSHVWLSFSSPSEFLVIHVSATPIRDSLVIQYPLISTARIERCFSDGKNK